MTLKVKIVCLAVLFKMKNIFVAFISQQFVLFSVIWTWIDIQSIIIVVAILQVNNKIVVGISYNGSGSIHAWTPFEQNATEWYNNSALRGGLGEWLELWLVVRVFAHRYTLHHFVGGCVGAHALLDTILSRWLRLVRQSNIAIQLASHPNGGGLHNTVGIFHFTVPPLPLLEAHLC